MTSPSPVNVDPEGEGLLPLSGLNDLLYCDRRCWLHRVGGMDADNVHTLLGSFEHERTDEPTVERRPGLRIERALPLISYRLGLIGRADVVEFRLAEGGVETPYPVDYKHARRRKWDNDDVQLCAQALCLEEMLYVGVPAGAVFHVFSKRRREVVFTDALRQQVCQAAEHYHRLVRMTEPPEAVLKPQCDGCAMRTHCLPEAAGLRDRAEFYMQELYMVEHQE